MRRFKSKGFERKGIVVERNGCERWMLENMDVIENNRNVNKEKRKLKVKEYD